MITLPPLARIMVAPNGARRTTADHPALPMHIDEIVTTAVQCAKQGADGIHLHVRNPEGAHVLDAGLYKEALSELQQAAPTLQRQITTEAVGQYSPEQQRQLVRDVQPESVSIAISEMLSETSTTAAYDFYTECDSQGVAVQHIIYDAGELQPLETVIARRPDSAPPPQLLFVLGRYAKNQQSCPVDLLPFVDWVDNYGVPVDWAVCAFGSGETDCLVAAHQRGGKCRVGFENSLWNRDGSVASDNAERVREVVTAIS